MLSSIPRVFIVVVFALVSFGMAAPTPVTTPTSLDDRVEELTVKVNELALAAKSKDVSAKQFNPKICAIIPNTALYKKCYCYLICQTAYDPTACNKHCQ